MVTSLVFGGSDLMDLYVVTALGFRASEERAWVAR
jgi:hypothetical protein